MNRQRRHLGSKRRGIATSQLTRVLRTLGIDSAGAENADAPRRAEPLRAPAAPKADAKYRSRSMNAAFCGLPKFRLQPSFMPHPAVCPGRGQSLETGKILTSRGAIMNRTCTVAIAMATLVITSNAADAASFCREARHA